MGQLKFLCISLAFFAGLSSNACSQTAADAQSQGLSLGSSAASANSSFTASPPTTYLPGYSATPPSNLTSAQSASSLVGVGTKRNAECDQQGINMGGGSSAQECNASDILRQNTNKQRFSAGDNIATATAATFTADNLLGQTTSSKTCTTTTVNNPAVTNNQTCNDFLSSTNQTCNNVLNATFTQAPGCTVDGQYLGLTKSGDICPGCLDHYVLTEYYCSGGGYKATAYTSTSGSRGDVYDPLFSNVYVQATVGVNVSNVFVGDFGYRCNFPIYYSQSCDGLSCAMSTNLIGSTCSGKDFVSTGQFQIPTHFVLNESWDNGCTQLDGLVK